MNLTVSTPLPLAFEKCLDDRQLQFSVLGSETLIMKYLTPLFILFGISGNILNLTVLMVPGMRTRSNKLLSCLAFADIICLLSMTPHCLAHYEIFWRSWWFHRSYGHLKIWIMGVNNWTMAGASWLVFVICLERLLVIKYPFKARRYLGLLKPKRVIPMLIAFTFIFTSYNYVSHTCRGRFFCRDTQYHAMCIAITVPPNRWFKNQENTNSEFLKDLVLLAPKVSAVLMVMLPCILVIALNVLLIMELKDRKKLFTPNNAVGSTDSRYNEAHSKTEHKVTITVTAIVTCFTITQSPSAFVNFFSQYIHESYLSHMNPICTILVILGKSLNFVLFCLSSANFRKRLTLHTKEGIFRRSTSRSVSMLTASTVVMDQLASQSRPVQNRRTNSSSQLLSRVPQHRASSAQSMAERVPLKDLTRRGTSFV